jgi:VIT1/CCC1 family predicted Fe2+/Mn2+ transporter
MQTESQVAALGHVIQLAVAPVFLLSGVSGLLGVLTNRLTRIIDRARVLEERLVSADPPGQERMHGELRLLSQRARLINRAISLCTVCALLICAVIIALFMAAFLETNVAIPISLTFTGSMLALFAGLVSFLREIHIATRSLRIGPH